jgi:hypothetical protein
MTPHAYAEWVPLIERFRDGDDSALTAMRAGTMEWTNIVAERWTSRMSEALNIRLKKVSADLQLALDRARGDAFSVSRAMLGARRALAPLQIAASLPCAPENVRTHFADELTRFIAQTQESLESGAKRIRVDNGTILKAIRDNPLTAPPPSPSESEMPSDPQPPSGRGRRVIL